MNIRIWIVGCYLLLPMNAAFALYDSSLGRWTSRDPIGEQGGVNVYAYAGNDPINFTDPLGLLQVSAEGNLIVTPRMQSMLDRRTDTVFNIYTAKTNRGTPITVYREVDSANHDNSTDCHGTTFTNGGYWINNNQVNTILADDGWTSTAAPQPGDIGVYLYPDGSVAHSVTVTGQTPFGEPTVTSKGGITEIQQNLPASQGWYGAAPGYYTGGGNTVVK